MAFEIPPRMAFLLKSQPVRISEHAMVRTWVYPVERFWKYIPSPETERWCRFFGFGHEESHPGAYLIGNTWLIHPTIWEAIKQALPEFIERKK